MEDAKGENSDQHFYECRDRKLPVGRATGWATPKQEAAPDATEKSREKGNISTTFDAVAMAAHTGVKMKIKAQSTISRRNWSCIVSPGGRCLFEFNWSTGRVKKSLNLTASQVRKERRLLLASTIKDAPSEDAGERHLWNILHSRSIGTGVHTNEWAEMLDEKVRGTLLLS